MNIHKNKTKCRIHCKQTVGFVTQVKMFLHKININLFCKRRRQSLPTDPLTKTVHIYKKYVNS